MQTNSKGHTEQTQPTEHPLSRHTYWLTDTIHNNAKLCLYEKKPDYCGATHRGFPLGTRPWHYLDNFTDQYQLEYFPEGSEKYHHVLQCITANLDRARRGEKEAEYFRTKGPLLDEQHYRSSCEKEQQPLPCDASSDSPDKVI